MTSVYWNGGTGSWNIVSNWTPQEIPGVSNDVYIVATGTNVVNSTSANSAGTLTLSATSTLVISSSFQVESAMTNGGLVTVNDGSTLTLSGTINNAGTIALDSTGDVTALIIAGDVSLSGSGIVELNSIFTTIASNGSPATLTNTSTISGTGDFGDSDLTLDNGQGGVIDADGSAGLYLYTGANTITNAGTLEAINGSLLSIQSDVSNSGGVIEAIGSGSSVSVSTAIEGGTLSTSGNSVIVAEGATFANLTNTGIVTVNDGSTLTLSGTINNAGTIALDSTGDVTALIIAGDVSLSGSGIVELNSIFTTIASNGSPATLTNTSTISGTGDFGDSDLTLDNGQGGVIDADGSAGLYLYTGANTITNAGTLEAINGSLLSIQSNVSNSGGVIEAIGSGSSVSVSTAIEGGTLSTSGNSVIVAEGATFANLTNTGIVTVNDGSTLTLSGTINNAGTIALDSTGDVTALIIAGDVSLSGSGIVELNSIFTTIASNGSPATLTNTSTISGTGDFGDSDLTLDNGQGGVIDADGSAGLYLYTGANTITNAGTLEAINGSLLSIQSNVSNSGGVIEADSATVDVTGVVTGAGSAVISGAGIIEFGAGSAENTSFAAGATGTLVLDQVAVFTGTIFGFAVGDEIDLASVVYTGSGSATLATGNKLEVSEGGQTYVLQLDPSATYTDAAFVLTPDANGDTDVSEAVAPAATVAGDWATPSYWRTGALPGAADDVLINNSTTIVDTNPNDKPNKSNGNPQQLENVGTVRSVTVTSELTFDYGALTTIEDFINQYDTAIDIGGFDGGEGGSQLDVGGTLTNDYSLRIGNANLLRPTIVVANGLVNPTSSGTASGGTIDLIGSTTSEATLDINAPAGSGSPGTLSGIFDIEGDALLEFASGQITTITGELLINGTHAFVADSINLTSNSALAGLTTIGPGADLDIENAPSVTVAGNLLNEGFIYLDNAGDGGENGNGGGLVSILGTLTNNGTIDIGNSHITAPDKITADGLDNTSSITLTGASTTNTATLAITGLALNTGTLDINPFASVTVDGTYEQTAGTLAIEAKGTQRSVRHTRGERSTRSFRRHLSAGDPDVHAVGWNYSDDHHFHARRTLGHVRRDFKLEHCHVPKSRQWSDSRPPLQRLSRHCSIRIRRHAEHHHRHLDRRRNWPLDGSRRLEQRHPNLLHGRHAWGGRQCDIGGRRYDRQSDA